MMESYVLMMQHNCLTISFATLMWGIISQLLMVVNSSINFFIYCASSTTFREVLTASVRDSGLVRVLCPTLERRFRRGHAEAAARARAANAARAANNVEMVEAAK